MYAYGLLCENSTTKTGRLRKAACEGNRGAARALATECSDLDERRRWWRLTMADAPDRETCDLIAICKILADRERWLAEADRNGWPSAYADSFD